MNAPQYKPGGAEWHKVEAIMQACTMSRLRAVSALKSCNNDQDAAIRSLDEALLISKPMTRLAVGGATVEVEPSDNGNETGDIGDAPAPTRAPPPGRPTTTSPDLPSPTKLSGVKRDLASSEVKSKGYSKPAVGHQDSEKEQTGPQPAKHVFFNDDYSTHWASNMSKTRAGIKPTQPKKPQKPEDAPEVLDKSPPPRRSTPPSPRKVPLVVPEGQWNLRLPKIELGPEEPEFTAEEGLTQGFSIRRLVHAMQGDMKRGMIQHYLAFFSETVVAKGINAPLAGFPAIFYAVATNDDKIVRTWVNNGGDVNAVDETYKVPLFAFAIMMADTLGKHTTAVTTTLLSLGADVSVIPRVFFLPYMDDPPNKAPFNHRYTEFNEPTKEWCLDYMRPVLARTINLTQRYFLARTLTERRPSERQTQVAITNGALALLGIGYFMVGQSSAAKMVIQKSLSTMALPKAQPLVMVFSGPSGHGKTELAKRMGELLSLELECVDCTELRYETDLFGPKKPYIGHELGSPLNNFLTRLSGRRCIVFLDEFEKTTPDVQNSLLVPFDEGKYTDRRNRQAVDCSKTIWIMATNALDDTILDFCDLHQAKVHQTDDSHRHAELMNDLSGRLKKQLKSTFGNPLSSRVSLVVPFLPFSAGEQAVVAHKYVLDLQDQVRQKIQVSGHQLVGRIILDVRQDGAICKLIAQEGYDASQGARSLKAAVETRIEDELVHRYLEEDGRIEDWQPLVNYTVDLSRNGVLSVFKTAD